MSKINTEQRKFMESLGFQLIKVNIKFFGEKKESRAAIWRIDCNGVTSDVLLDHDVSDHNTMIYEIMCAIASFGIETGKKEVREGLQELLGVKW